MNLYKNIFYKINELKQNVGIYKKERLDRIEPYLIESRILSNTEFNFKKGGQYYAATTLDNNTAI